MSILNLTQHNATPEQISAGVFEPSIEDKKVIQNLLTFEDIPSKEELESRAYELATLVTNMGAADAKQYRVMVGCAPYFMSFLEKALKEQGHRPLYAFSRRESVDQLQPDGSVRKIAVFKHIGFVEY